MPGKIENGSVVTLQYKLYLENDEFIEESEADDPLVYLHGYDNIIPGLEKALTGLGEGDEKTVTVPAADAYGEYDDDGVMEVPVEDLPEDLEPEEGMVLQITDPQGEESLAEIVEITEDGGIVLDFNHPLAGEDLKFEVKVLAIRQATDVELEHGHAHSGDHHHH